MGEDPQTFRTLDSLNLFSSIVNSEQFLLTPIILVFTKIDIFPIKVRSRSAIFRKRYPTFAGDFKYPKNVLNHIIDVYKSKIPPHRSSNLPIEILTVNSLLEDDIYLLLDAVSSTLSNL